MHETLIKNIRRHIEPTSEEIEILVKGKHFLQEDSPMEIGLAIAEFVKKLR